MYNFFLCVSFMLVTILSTSKAQTQVGSTFEGDSDTRLLGISGISLSNDGSRFAISGRRISTGYGFIRVFEWGANTWSQVGDDISDVGSLGIGTKLFLSADGNRVASTFSSSTGLENSKHQIYEWDGISWIQLGKGIENLGSSDFTLSGSGNRIAYVADSCRINVLEWDGLNWNQLGNSFENSLGNVIDWGSRISLSYDGEQLAFSPFGIFLNHCNIQDAEVKIFNWNGAAWVQMGSSIIGTSVNTNFGNSVVLSSSGEIIAVSELNNNNTNLAEVKIYKWDGSTWTQMGSSIKEVEDESGFARTLSLSDNGQKIAISTTFSDDPEEDAGHVDIFSWNGNDWEKSINTVLGEEEEGFFGMTLSLASNGNRFAAASVGFTPDDFLPYGKARVFETGITSIKKPDNGSMIKFLPNPANEKIRIIGAHVFEIQVMNSQGKVLIKQEIQNSDIDISKLINGIYFILIKTDEGIVIKKIIKA